MNGVNTNTTQNNSEPTIISVTPQATPAPVPLVTPSQDPVAQPKVVPPTPVVPTPEPQPVPETNSLGSNVKVAPPQAQPINASARAVDHKPEPTPTPTETQPPIEEKKEETVKPIEPPKKKSGGFFIFIIFLALIGLNVYQYMNTQSIVKQLNYDCTPVSTYEQEKELDTKSTIVRDLYNKVQTNIREDLAHFTFDDELKRYLAFRQIPTRDYYDSNCNLFDNSLMQLYTCPTSKDFQPKAFKGDTFEREYKKLFGERNTVPHGNIQLGNKCLGGYQYISERGEYVQGTCKENVSTAFKAIKTLTKAISRNNTIKLYEEVTYKGTESQTVPEYLKNGTYTYTFKLDTNYNYAYVSREFTPKY